MNRSGAINLYQMGNSWEHGARFVSEPYYWRHNIASDLQRLDKEDKAIDLTVWPLAAEVVRRWGDKAITVRLTRKDGSAWNTRFNGTEHDAKNYFMGMTGTEMHHGEEVVMSPVVKVEVLHG
jgi:hypothetical protein